MDFLEQNADRGSRSNFLVQARMLSVGKSFLVPEFVTLGATLCEDVDIGISQLVGGDRFLADDPGVHWMKVDSALIDAFYLELLRHRKSIVGVGEQLGDMDLLVRPSPLDELKHPHLSFAGVYSTHIPKGEESDLVYAAAKVLAGRFSRFANLYYRRHHINSSRSIGLMFMKPVNKRGERNLIHGTAYATHDHLRTEYVVRPIDIQNESNASVMVIRNNIVQFPRIFTEIEEKVSFSSKIERCMVTLFNHFKRPIDVEYLFDANGDLNVVQVRYMSRPHCTNWLKMPLVSESRRYSAIINSVGTIQGTLFDCRNRGSNLDGMFEPENIIVVSHHQMGDDYGVLDVLNLVDGRSIGSIRLIVDHGENRVRDHVQYVIPEDPSVGFIFQTDDQFLMSNLKHGDSVTLVSNGIELELIH